MEVYIWFSLIFFLSGKTCDSALVLKVEQDTIELGKQLKISCEAVNGSFSGNRKWERVTTYRNHLICYNGVSTNPKKYREEQLSDVKYMLIISNVTVADINCPYACIVGFQTAEKYVNASEHNFKNLPTPDTVQTEYIKTENNYSLTVTFPRVYPIPSCMVQSKNLTIVYTQQHGLLYEVQMSDQSKEPFHSCGSPVSVECFFGVIKYPIKIHHDFNCNSYMDTLDVSNILLPVLLIIVTVVTVIVLVLKRKKLRKHCCLTTNDEGNEGCNKPWTRDFFYFLNKCRAEEARSVIWKKNESYVDPNDKDNMPSSTQLNPSLEPKKENDLDKLLQNGNDHQ